MVHPRLTRRDFLSQRDHTRPLGQSSLKWRHYKIVPSWSMRAVVSKCVLLKSAAVPPIRRRTVKQVPTLLPDIRCDVGVQKELALRGNERQDHGWQAQILRPHRVAEVMRPAECRRAGGMSSRVSMDCINGVRSNYEPPDDMRSTRTRLRFVVQVSQQCLEILGLDAHLVTTRGRWPLPTHAGKVGRNGLR